MKKIEIKKSLLKSCEWIALNFSIPMFFVLLLSLVPILNYNKNVTHTCTWLAIAIIAICIISSFFLRKTSFKPCRGFIVSSIISIVISLYLSSLSLFTESILYYIIGIIVFELYAISYVIINTITHSTPFANTVMMFFQFIFFGYIAIFIGTYNFDNNNIIFNSLITLFSAIVGGSLTLGGVAWTIKNNNEENRNDAKLKYKPFLLFSDSDRNFDKHTYCNDDNLYNPYTDEKEVKKITCTILPFLVENTSNADCIIKSIIINDVEYSMHDRYICRNEVVQLRINDSYRLLYSKEPINNISFTVCDLLGNKYYFLCSFIEEKMQVTDADEKEIDGQFIYRYRINGVGLPESK